MAEHQLPKLNTGVRFPSPAPKTASIKGYLPFLYFSHFTLVSLFFRLPVVRSLHYSLFTFLSSLNLSSLAEEGEPRQGKPEGFCLPCKGRWVAAGKPEGFLGSMWNLNKKRNTF